jgi:regulator of RNase E activity RraA
MPMDPIARERLGRAGVAAVTAALFRRNLRNQFLVGLAPLTPSLPNMVGPAFTLRFIPAREDIDTFESSRRSDSVLRRAVEECPPGAVLMVDAGFDRRAGTAGDLLAGRLKFRGCAGMVTDGGFRDVRGVRKLGFAAYHNQVAAGPPILGLHAADIETPIGCAGVAIYPGDIVVGDDDGVVVIPVSLAEEIALEAAEATAYETFAEQKIAEGHPMAAIFPATAASKAEFEDWRSQVSPALVV